MYNRNNGKAAIGRRVNEPGQYNHLTRLNVMVGISGAVATPVQHAGRWVDMWTEGGTDVNRFMDFIDDILEDIGQGTPGNRRCFTMDNLIAHK